MAEKSPYTGKVPNSGTMNVKAPNQTTKQKTGKVKTGSDLRAKGGK